MNDLVIQFLLSNTGMALVLSLGGIIITALAKRSSKFATMLDFLSTYRGTIISGVKRAEKAIPDNTENKYIHRFDHALKYVVDLVEAHENRKLSKKEVAAIGSAINEAHHEIEQ